MTGRGCESRGYKETHPMSFILWQYDLICSLQFTFAQEWSQISNRVSGKIIWELFCIYWIKRDLPGVVGVQQVPGNDWSGSWGDPGCREVQGVSRSQLDLAGARKGRWWQQCLWLPWSLSLNLVGFYCTLQSEFLIPQKYKSKKKFLDKMTRKRFSAKKMFENFQVQRVWDL